MASSCKRIIILGMDLATPGSSLLMDLARKLQVSSRISCPSLFYQFIGVIVKIVVEDLAGVLQ